MTILIMATDSIVFRTVFHPYNYYFLTVVGAICAMLVLGNLHIFSQKNKFPLALFFAFSIIVTSLIYLDTDFFVVYKILVIALGLYLFVKWDISKLANIYVSVIVFIALFSIIGTLANRLIISNPIFPTLNDGEYGTKTAFFYNIRLGWTQLVYYRNQGPFWEPGAFQAYLNLAVFFKLFLVKRNLKNLEFLILITAVFSTLSTTGIIVLCLLILARGINNDKSDWKFKTINVVTIVTILGISLFNSNINEQLFSKFNNSSSSVISSETRKESIITNMKIISQNPFTGFGITNGSGLYNKISSLNKDIDQNVNTSTLLYSWSIFGIVYALLSLYAYMKLSTAFVKGILPKIIVLIAILIITNTEDWTYSVWFNVLLIYGIMMPSVKRINSNEVIPITKIS
ncbi:O-antigen ligase family protein [Priestia koreensis]|nr:O-antigen ligase family protein [Priestia koreensis]